MSGFFKQTLNPEGLFRSPAFSQAVSVRGPAKTLYIGGQNAVNAQGEIVGPGDLKAQTRQALENIRVILDAEGATFQDLIKFNIYLLQGVDPREGFAAFQEMTGPQNPPPLVTAVFVAALANPAFLVEIEAIAVVEDRP